MNTGKGDFTSEGIVEPRSGSPPAVGDFDGDQRDDIVTTSIAGFVTFSRGLGQGKFEQKQKWEPVPEDPFLGFQPHGVALGDINRDGILDVVCGGFGFCVLLGRGDFTFGDLTRLHSTGEIGKGMLTDLDGDGWLDLAFAEQTNLWVQRNLTIAPFFAAGGRGWARPLEEFGKKERAGGSAMAEADLNGDRFADVVITAAGGVMLYLNETDGKGNFGFLPKMLFGADPDLAASRGYGDGTAVATGDLNRDGRTDIVAASSSGCMDVWLNQGNGEFTWRVLPLDHPGKIGWSLLIDDFDGDGWQDLVVSEVATNPDDESPSPLRLWLNRRMW